MQETNDVFTDILQNSRLSDAVVSMIKEYHCKNELQNQEGLDRYIDKILTEKEDKRHEFIKVSEIMKDKE